MNIPISVSKVESSDNLKETCSGVLHAQLVAELLSLNLFVMFYATYLDMINCVVIVVTNIGIWSFCRCDIQMVE